MINATPVWGGTGYTGPSVDNYIYYDDFYIGTTEPDVGETGGGGGGTYPSAADPDATTATRAVLGYLQHLSPLTNAKLLSGQVIGWSGEYDLSLFTDIYTETGKYPAVMSANLSTDGYDWPMDWTGMLTALKNHWDAGGLIELAWHMDNPANGAGPWESGATQYVDLVQLITSGTSLNTAFNTIIDDQVSHLEDLRDHGCVVFIRPFLEMTGNWFWWGARDTAQYKNMWIYLFNRLTNTHGLHNLLFVFSGDWNDSAGAINYYPGGDYVDIVGIDVYSSDGRFPTQAGYASLMATGKPFAITELGQCGVDGGTCTAKDTEYIATDLKANMPGAVYFSVWNEQYSLVNHNNLTGLFGNSYVLDRSEVDVSVGGEDTVPPYTSTFSPTKYATDVTRTTRTISFHILDSGDGVVSSSIYMRVNGTTYTVGSGLSTSGTSADYTVTRTMTADWDYGEIVNIAVGGADANGNWMTEQNYYFVVEGAVSGSDLQIVSSSVPYSYVGVPFSYTMVAANVTGTATWTVYSGTLPTGLSLSTSGVLSGTPTSASSDSITFKVVDSSLAEDTRTITVSALSNTAEHEEWVREVDGGDIIAKSITSLQIGADAILAEHVGTNEIIAHSANIKDLVVTSVKIEDNAVTVPVCVNGVWSPSTVGTDGSPETLASTTITTHGQPLWFIVSVELGEIESDDIVTFDVYLNSSNAHETSVTGWRAAGAFSFSFAITGWPAATYNVYLKAYMNGSYSWIVSAGWRTLMLLECRK
jgi:hypothetical protein